MTSDVDQWFSPGRGIVHDSEPIVTPVEVEQEILRLVERLGRVTDDLHAASRNAAQADAKYKQANAQSYLMAQGKTVGDREAVAAIECADEYLERRIAEAMQLTVQESLRSIRAQLSALQTVSANLRAQT